MKQKTKHIYSDWPHRLTSNINYTANAKSETIQANYIA